MDILGILRSHLDDRYDVRHELGRGGMATVYHAQERATGREVAIKVLNPNLSATIGADRFTREIALASRMTHPNILGCDESGSADGLLFYMMPLVRGESLRDRLIREGQLSVAEALRITRGVAAALGFAHAQGVVHRDIKPDNVMLEGDAVLVADFGIARAVSEQDAQKLTQTGTAVGTPVYMSPEQCYGHRAGPPSDLYALGCMLYEMLAGEPPFSGLTATAIMSRHAMEDPPSIRIIRPSVPEYVERAIFALLEKVPADRPQTSDELVALLDPATAPTAPVTPPSRRVGRRDKGEANVTASGDGRQSTWGLGLDQVVVPWYKKRGVIIATILTLVAGLGAGGWWLSRSARVSSGEEARRLAVLYFDNATGSKELDYLADALTESLIDKLSTVQSLYVVSRGGSALFRGKDVPSDSIARALDVGVLIRGSLAKEGDNYSVSARLIDAASGTDLNRIAVTLPATNAIGLQDSLAVQVADAIRAQLGTEITMRDRRDATQNEEAWILVQRAERARKQAEDALATGDGDSGERAFAEAESLLVMASTLDDQWPDPLTLGAMIAYRRARLAQSDPTTVRKWIDSGLVLAERAIARSAENASALEARGNLRYLRGISGLEADVRVEEEQVNLAKRDLEEAVRINAIQAGAWATLSHLYYRVGTNFDVNSAAKSAFEADAFLSNADVVLNRLFLSSYDIGDITPTAEKYCKTLNRRFPGTLNAARCQLYLLTAKQITPDVPRAWALVDSVTQRAPEPKREFQKRYAQLLVAAVLARSGARDSASRMVARLQGTEEIDPTRELPYASAFVYVLLGDTTKAVDHLREFFLANEARRSAYAEDPGWWFRPIAESEDFRKLVKSVP